MPKSPMYCGNGFKGHRPWISNPPSTSSWSNAWAGCIYNNGWASRLNTPRRFLGEVRLPHRKLVFDPHPDTPGPARNRVVPSGVCVTLLRSSSAAMKSSSPGYRQRSMAPPLLHLSDLHLDANPAYPAALIERLPHIHYDVCVMTGDFQKTKTYGPHQAAIAALAQVSPHVAARSTRSWQPWCSIHMAQGMQNAAFEHPVAQRIGGSGT